MSVIDEGRECCKKLQKKIKAAQPIAWLYYLENPQYINFLTDDWLDQVRYCEREGRHMVARTKILPGEVIMVDPPYSTSLFSAFYHSHCLHCFKRWILWSTRPILQSCTLHCLLPLSLLTLLQEVNIAADPPYSTSLFSAFYHSHCLHCFKRWILWSTRPTPHPSSPPFTTLTAYTASKGE
jgi:hypothetical protein